MLRRSATAILIASIISVSSTGCIGQMAVSGLVRKFNLSVVEDKWAREIVFLCLYFIPVYPFAAGIDLFIVNSVEFHTGTNPLTDKPSIALRDGTQELVTPEGVRVIASPRDDGGLDLRASDLRGDRHHDVSLVPVPGGIEVRDGSGDARGRVDSDGAVRLSVLAPADAPGR